MSTPELDPKVGGCIVSLKARDISREKHLVEDEYLEQSMLKFESYITSSLPVHYLYLRSKEQHNRDKSESLL